MILILFAADLLAIADQQGQIEFISPSRFSPILRGPFTYSLAQNYVQNYFKLK